jgi:hypothetical protein
MIVMSDPKRTRQAAPDPKPHPPKLQPISIISIHTFTTDGTVDEETQRNDLAVIRQVIGATEPMAVTRGYDFSLARAADRELTQSGWRP